MKLNKIFSVNRGLTFALFNSILIFSASDSFAVTLVPEKVVPVIQDRQDFQTPDNVQLEGWIGSRINVNEKNRLAQLDAERLLEGYRKRPGRQTWDGEHVGKWLHAGTLAWVNTGDSALRKKLDFIAAELVKCQLPNGYLGTYSEDKRWTEWDVWAHKYNLIGLVAYMRYTGNMEPLPACRRMADLLCNTFGDEPGKRDLVPAGQHMGMAATSVLEPMALLYRLTGEPRYLDFCKYIMRAWEQPNGPKIVSKLLAEKSVGNVGNGKAYEMLSCLNGALEYYRTVGDPKLLQACLYAWQDIVDHRLYLTGAASYREFFHAEGDFPNVSNVGETCVTVTWLQFNAQLMRLTGEVRFAEQLEKVVLNQLFGAQSCDGTAWGYYVQMEGKKPYSSSLDAHCCLSSGPRGVALIPTFATSTDADGAVINLYEAGTAKLTLRDKTKVTLTTKTLYPSNGKIIIKVSPDSKRTFSIKVRIPAWCSNAVVKVDGKKMQIQSGADGYVALKREWKKGDEVELQFKLEPRIIVGTRRTEGKIAVLYGPLVLAADEALFKKADLSLNVIGVAASDLASLKVTPEPAPEKLKTWKGAEVFRINAIARKTTNSLHAGEPLAISLIPFADAGSTGTPYKIWLPYGEKPATRNVLMDGLEIRSRKPNAGSINDDDFETVAATFSNKKLPEDWFGVDMLPEPVVINRVIFVHGKAFKDGGWFDASGGKPRVEIKTSVGGNWMTLCEIKDYPATTATDSAGLKDGQQFKCELDKPVEIVAMRIIGKPASGNNTRQAFASCAELQAFR